MPNSLKAKIKKLAHNGRISSEECDELLTKLDGHDAEIRADVIDEVIKIAIAEIDFESREEQHRFVDFMEGLKDKK